MRREAARMRALRRYLAKQIGDVTDEHSLYALCAHTNWFRGMKQIARCVYALVAERDRAVEAMRVITKEIKSANARHTLIRICFRDWDGSPFALQSLQTRAILHCVKTNARYYRLHGRF